MRMVDKGPHGAGRGRDEDAAVHARAQRIQQIAAAVRSGSYVIDFERLAGAIARDHLAP